MTHALQAVQWPPLTLTFRFLNLIGGSVPTLGFALLILAVLLLTRYLDLFLVFVAVCFLRALGAIITFVADRPRPTDLLAKVSEHETSPSFPSGHVLSTVLFFGLLAILIEAAPLPRGPRRAIQAPCLAVIVLMGPARVFAGAQWPTDALGGYLWGALLLALVVHGGRALGLLPRRRWRRRRPE